MGIKLVKKLREGQGNRWACGAEGWELMFLVEGIEDGGIEGGIGIGENARLCMGLGGLLSRANRVGTCGQSPRVRS